MAAAHAAPAGAIGRPSSQASAVASGAIMPVRAPASIVMLQSVMRSSIAIAATVGPAYSTAWPAPPAAPTVAMTASATSFAATPGPSRPEMAMRISRGRVCTRVWVAMTCSTSDVPMPKASAPKAPWVEVWLSPQTTVRPGRTKPCSGPTTWTIPCVGPPSGRRGIPKPRAFASSAAIWAASRGGAGRPSVGTR